MSEVSENKDSAFRDWKKELDEKCAEHLKKNPERAPVNGELTVAGIRAAVDTLRGVAAVRREKVSAEEVEAKKLPIVRVAELSTQLGTWVVYAGKAEYAVFFGQDAHRRASKCASDLLNSNTLGLDRRDDLGFDFGTTW